MTLIKTETFYKWWKLSWLLFAITLPWLDVANNVSLIFIAILWLIEGNFINRLKEIKNEKWAWPLIAYYFILVAGCFYTNDFDNALFTLDKKISFLVLPFLAITGHPFDNKFISVLKRGFVYSCFAVILVGVTATGLNFFSGGAAANFDLFSESNFNKLHPDAAPVWRYFSYIQLVDWIGLHPGYFSMYLAFSIIILLTEESETKIIRFTHFILTLLMAISIAMLSSRMAIIAFFASCVFLLWRRMAEKKFKNTATIILICGIVGFFLWTNPIAKFRVIEEPLKTEFRADTSVTQWNSVSYRLLEWQAAWSIIKSHVFFGVGTGGGTMAMINFYDHFNQSTVGIQSNAHNQFLQSWMESGLIGLSALLFCLMGPLIVTRSYNNTVYVCFLIIFILMCATESVVERQKGIVFFTFFQTLFLAFERKAK